MKKTEWINWLVLILLALIWGTSFILIKKSLIAYSDYQVASLRIAISSLAFLPVILWEWRRINWKKWDRFLIVGLTGSGIPPFLFSAAQTQISSSLAGALNGLTSIFTLIVAMLFFNQKWDKSKALGVLLGLLGAGFIILFNNRVEGNFFYAMLIVVATILYAFNGNMVKWFFVEEKPLHISAVSIGMLGPGALIILFSSDFLSILKTHPQAGFSLGAVTILALMSTVFSSVVFFRLIQKTNAVFASTVTYLIPFIAVLWGLFDGESFHWFYLVCLIVILVGVYLTRK